MVVVVVVVDALNTLYCSVTYCNNMSYTLALLIYMYNQQMFSQMFFFHRHTILYVLPTHLLLGPEHVWNLLYSGCT